MKGRGAREMRSSGIEWPKPGRQGPVGRSAPGAGPVRSTPRYRERTGDTAWRRAPKGAQDGSWEGKEASVAPAASREADCSR